MTLSQSKKLSQMTADNAQWEDRQLLRSGAVRGTEVQTEFDDEDERKVMLLVHGMFFPCHKFLLAISVCSVLVATKTSITPILLRNRPHFSCIRVSRNVPSLEVMIFLILL
jgi:hypothetical protein